MEEKRVRMKKSYKQNVKKTIENLNKLKAQSLAKGKPIPQDIVIAEKRLREYVEVMNWLWTKGYRVKNGGEVTNLD